MNGKEERFNDEVINCYFTKIEQPPKCITFSSFWLPLVNKGRTFSKQSPITKKIEQIEQAIKENELKWIIIPHCLDEHWTLVLLDCENANIIVLDPG